MICQTMYILTLIFKEENAGNYIENYLYFLYNWVINISYEK